MRDQRAGIQPGFEDILIIAKEVFMEMGKTSLMMDIEKLFDKEYEGFCYQNCIREILNYYQCKEYDFYINMSLSTKMILQEEDYYICYDKDAYGIITSELEKVQRIDDERDGEIVLAENLRRVAEGYPIITCVDGYYLQYFSYYKEKHCRHNLILTGKGALDNITVLDWYAPHFYCGEIATNKYLMARESSNPEDGSIYSGSPIRNNWAIIERDGWNQHREELIYENLSLSLAQYFPSDPNEKNILYGIRVYQRIREELKGMVYLEPKIRCGELRYVHRELYQTVKRKYLFSYFLRLIREKVNSNLVEKAIEYLQDLIADWEKFMTVLLKCSFRGKETDIQKLEDMLAILIGKEEGLYDHVFYIKNNL